MTSSEINFDIKQGQFHWSKSHYKTYPALPTTFITAAEADISNLSPTSLLSYSQGFHKSNFLPKLTPEQVLYAQQTQKALPTWAFTLHASTLNDDPHISDLGFHYKSSKFFFKGNYSRSQVSLSTGIEVWRDAAIANGVIRWRAAPDVYANSSTRAFWQDIYDVQQWIQLLRITNPGARYVDLYDHNGRVVHRIDLLQSSPLKPAFIDADPEQHPESSLYGTFPFASTSKMLTNVSNNEGKKQKIKTDNRAAQLQLFIEPIDDSSSYFDDNQEDGDSYDEDDNDNDTIQVPNHLSQQHQSQNSSQATTSIHNNKDTDQNAPQFITLAKIHTPLLPLERQRQEQLLKQPFISPLQPMFNYIQNSIDNLDLSQYSPEQLEQYLDQVHQLAMSLPHHLHEGMEHYEIYSSIQSLLQQLPFPTSSYHLFDQSVTQDPALSPTPSTPPLISSHPPNQINTSISIITPPPVTSSQSKHIDLYSDEYIVNNGDPFDMSNISDVDILRLPRSDTPYTFNPDPYYLSSRALLFTTARLLQLPTIFKYLNIYTSLHYSYIPDDVIAEYKPNHMSKINKLKRQQISAHPNENDTTDDSPIQYEKKIDFTHGEHRASLACHIHTQNDRFHAIVATSPADQVYSGRVTFVIDDKTAHLDSYHVEHPLSLEKLPFFKHPAQNVMIPDVYYIDGIVEQYHRSTTLPCTQHVLGFQALIYPGVLPAGYDPLSQPHDISSNTQKRTFQQQQHLLSKTTSPLSLPNLIGKFHPRFAHWYQKYNIQTSIEFQYAYIRPVNFDLMNLAEIGAEKADHALDWISLKSHSYWTPTYAFVPTQTHTSLTSVEGEGLTHPSSNTLQYTSITDHNDIQLKSNISTLPNIDITAPIATLIQPITVDPQLNTAPQLQLFQPSTFFKNSLSSIRVVGLDHYKKMINLAPWILSNKSIITAENQSILPSHSTSQVSSSSIPSTDQANDTKTLDQNTRTTQPNFVAISANSLYSIRKPTPYQRNLTLGCNFNTNGIVQSHALLDISQHWTLGASCEVDLVKAPTGAIRPLSQTPTATLGLEISFSSR